MEKGDVILCPVFSIANVPKTIVGQGLVCELVMKKGQYFLKYRVSEQDLEQLGQSYEKMLLKFRFLCTGLSVATLGHFWVQDLLLNEDLQPVWERRKVLRLEVDKEIDPSGPRPLTVKQFIVGEDVTYWIATNYPRVFNYHYIGLFLLRSSLPGEYLYADVLLNFFKIVELVTYARIKRNPKLGPILHESKTLKIIALDVKEMKEFYQLRCSDAAHDWDKVRGVTRRKAIECKMWAEELIIRDMLDRSKKPGTPLILEVHDSPQGAVVTTKFANSEHVTRNSD